MWIIPKNLPLWSSAQVTLACISDSNEQSLACASSLLVRSKPSLVRTWSQKWKRDSWTRFLSGRILKPFLDKRFGVKWASLSPVIHVSPFPLREKEEVLKILATYGPMCDDRSSSCSPISASLRTSRGIFLWDLEKFSQTSDISDTEWKAQVASQRGEYSQRVKSGRPTSASGSSSSQSGATWPTASCRDFKGESGAGRQERKGHPADTLPNAVALWPTISANESKNSEMGSQAANSSPPLGTAVHLYGLPDQENGSIAGNRQKLSLRPTLGTTGSEPQTDTETASPRATPQTRDARSGGIERWENPQERSRNLNDQAAAEMQQQNAKLNPRWVETLMGLPIGWTMPSCTAPRIIESTSCACSATGSCQRQPSEPSLPLGEGQGSSPSWATPTALNHDENYYQRSGNSVYPGLAKQVKDAWPTPAASDGERGGCQTDNMTGQSLVQTMNTILKVEGM